MTNKKINYKRFIPFIVIVLVILALLAFGLSRLLGGDPKPKEQKIQKDFSSIQKLPKTYTDKIEKSGKLTSITYDTSINDGSSRMVSKTAVVYLPYGYSKEKKYDVLYLVHGYGGHNFTFLGLPGAAREFKYVLDNMIAAKKVKPFIVVTPTYTEEITDYYSKLDAMGDEIVNDLSPAIEKKYSTYKSREHRAMAGFSMGGCATWRALEHHTDYFQYYLPMSMPMYYNDNGYVSLESQSYAQEIASGVAASGVKDFYVFAASGSEDFMNEATKKQTMDLCEYDGFTYTKKGFKEGNVMFHSWKGHGHHYYETYPYLYNGIIRFFRDSR